MKQTRAHEGSVFTLCTLQGGSLLSGGGKDRKIVRWSADLAPERECEVNHSCMCAGCDAAGGGLCQVPFKQEGKALMRLFMYPDSREIWSSPYHCRCGWGGTISWYNPQCHPQRHLLRRICGHSAGMLIIQLYISIDMFLKAFKDLVCTIPILRERW